MTATVRNLVIIFALAAIIAVVPGGGAGANTIIQAVSLAFLASLAWFAAVMYRRYRTEIYSLGERRRVILYVALGVAAVTLTATSRMWSTTAGELAWVALIAVCAYAVFSTLLAARRY